MQGIATVALSMLPEFTASVASPAPARNPKAERDKAVQEVAALLQIGQLLKRKPWLALRLLAHDIPEPQQPATA